MAPVGMVEPFVPGSNFAAYEDRLNQFFIINEVKPEQKTAYFITLMGAEIYELLTTLVAPELPSTKSYDNLMEIMRTHFAPKRSKHAERYRFYMAVQNDDETISDYIVRLKTLARTCNFGDYLGEETDVGKYRLAALEDALLDKFIVGLTNERIQQVLLNDEPKSFDKCCSIALNLEMTEIESKALQPESDSDETSSYTTDSDDDDEEDDDENDEWQTNNEPSVYGQSGAHASRDAEVASQHTCTDRYCGEKARARQSKEIARRHSYHPRSHYREQYDEQHAYEDYPWDETASHQYDCRRCGRDHEEFYCPAQHWTCFLCKRVGHTSRVCFYNRRRRYV